jgi:MFS family permease
MRRLVTERAARVRSHAKRFPRSFWILLVGDALESFSFGVVLPYFALYLTETIGASPAEAGVVLALWSFVALGATPLGGLLADRLGRRPVMLVSVAGAAVAAILFAVVSGLWAVAVLVVVWGLFSSLFDPAAAAYVADVVEDDLRTEAYGVQRIVANASFAVGPLVGSLLIWSASLRATFLCAGAALLAYLVFAWFRLPETRPVAGDDAPVARFRDALRDRLLVVLALGVGVSATGFAAYEGVLPVFLHEERALAIATWGLLFGINPLLIVLLQYPVARAVGRRSSRLMLALGAALIGISLAILVPSSNIAVLVAAIVLLTLGEMILVPVAMALAADLAPAHLRGSYQGALNLAWEVAWGPTTIVGLWLVGRGIGEVVLAAAIPLGALAAGLFLVLPGGRLGREPAVVSADPIRP